MSASGCFGNARTTIFAVTITTKANRFLFEEKMNNLLAREKKTDFWSRKKKQHKENERQNKELVSFEHEKRIYIVRVY